MIHAEVYQDEHNVLRCEVINNTDGHRTVDAQLELVGQIDEGHVLYRWTVRVRETGQLLEGEIAARLPVAFPDENDDVFTLLH